jgi:cytochrome b
MGALSVLAMLLLLVVQVATGLVGDDEIAFTGPLNKFVDSVRALAATWYHKRVGQWMIVALVVLHVSAVLFYLWKKQDNLIKPMLVGDKLMARPASPSRDDAPARLKALIVLAICGALVAGMVRFSG